MLVSCVKEAFFRAVFLFVLPHPKTVEQKNQLKIRYVNENTYI